MRYLVFADETNRYPVCLISRILRKQDLAEYVQGIETDVVAYSLSVSQKAKNSELKSYLEQLLPMLARLRTDYIICTDGALFKVLTGATRVDRASGYVFDCKIKDYTHLKVIYAPSPQQLVYDQTLRLKLQQALHALKTHRAGTYIPPGVDIFKTARFPSTPGEIRNELRELIDSDLAIDIETFDLKHYKAGIGTISMAWNKHEGIAFAVDLSEHAQEIRAILREFFILRAQKVLSGKTQAKTLYHNASFDVYVQVAQLFMSNLIDMPGMLFGLRNMLAGVEDTQLITYLATNSCVGNHLSLKAQAQEFAGNYMVDVEDIRAVPLPDLLTYNLTDALSTWFVYEKHYPTLVADQQLDIYENLFKPCLTDIIQMQLTGLPIDMEEVARGKAEMQLHSDVAVSAIMGMPAVAELETLLTEAYVEKKNAEYKKKRITASDVAHFPECKLNLNSAPKLQKLLYEVMGLPVIALTDSKQPATDGDTLKALINHTDDVNHKELLKNLVDFKAVDKILTSFIPAFEQAQLAPDGCYYLYGFYNLGGTLSGRLSSNNPNMQNLPSTGSRYAKTIKKMFCAPTGWLFVGLDFNSLEDMISALTTKDPNKLRVYTDGYDGHSLRAFYYFGSMMPDIIETVESINSIQKKYKPLRQDSKAPTFALTYQGTYRTLMVNCGFSEEKAKAIETAYHTMYEVSDKWVQSKLQEASKVGYVTVAFGLRVRTPMLKHCVLGTKNTPYEAEAEGRTAGNALGQSYGLLNSRAYMAFMQEVRKSKYCHDIKLCAQIHDAGYLLIRDDANLVRWVNENLVRHAKWQELDEIKHDTVKLGGNLSIFYPTWADELTLPNGADVPTLIQLAKEHMSQ